MYLRECHSRTDGDPTGGNIDFADIRTVLENAGSALMGIGTATGDNRAADAARAA